MKKNPENQNEAGIPSSIHFWMKLSLLIKSIIQLPSGFSDEYAILCHISGTLL